MAVPKKVFSYEQSCCNKKCHKKIYEEEQKKLFENCYSMESFDEPKSFIFSQVKYVTLDGLVSGFLPKMCMLLR